MKRIISILLSLVLVIGIVAGFEISANAESWQGYAKTVYINNTFSEYAENWDFIDPPVYVSVYKFTVPAKGTITFNMKDKNGNNPCYCLYKSSNLNSYCWFGYSGNRASKGYSGGYHYSNWKITVTAGTYYLQNCYSLNHDGKYIYKLNYKASVSKPGIKKCTGKKKAVCVKWNKISNATGYTIQYSTNSSMKSAKTITIKKASTTTRTITKLKAKKKYYFRVRAYKRVKEKSYKTYYSAWSAKKTVKTK